MVPGVGQSLEVSPEHALLSVQESSSCSTRERRLDTVEMKALLHGKGTMCELAGWGTQTEVYWSARPMSVIS